MSSRYYKFDIKTTKPDSKKQPIIQVSVSHDTTRKAYTVSVLAGERDGIFTTLFINFTGGWYSLESCNRFSAKRFAEVCQQAEQQAREAGSRLRELIERTADNNKMTILA